jgi:hypothetical protein
MIGTSTQLDEAAVALEGTISAAELESYQEIDNMSISDIIKQRFKGKEMIKTIKTP